MSREHELENPDCPCGVQIYRLCPECDGERCELCNFTGFSEASRADWEADVDGPFMALHREGPEDDTDPEREIQIMEALRLMQADRAMD